MRSFSLSLLIIYLILLAGCSKEEDQLQLASYVIDYRDNYIGNYEFKIHKWSWGPEVVDSVVVIGTHDTTYYFSGDVIKSDTSLTHIKVRWSYESDWFYVYKYDTLKGTAVFEIDPDGKLCFNSFCHGTIDSTKFFFREQPNMPSPPGWTFKYTIDGTKIP